MATKIAIMFEGRLHQMASPAAIFDDPVNLAVATFIGAPRMNILPGVLRRVEDCLVAEVMGAAIALPAGLGVHAGVALPAPVSIGIRPCDITVAAGHANGGLAAIVDFVEPMGSETFVTLRCDSHAVTCRASGRARFAIGESATLKPDAQFIYAFDPDTGAALIDRAGLAPSHDPQTRRVYA